MRPERAAEYLKLVKFFIFVARFKQKIKANTNNNNNNITTNYK
jgi:hypothetical protein